MRLGLIAALVGAGLVLSGCGESPAPPPKDAASAPSASTPGTPATDASPAAPAAPAVARPTVALELKTGKAIIELRPDIAPEHVKRFTQLTKEGFYNGLKFHRVIDGFMAQTGDPTGTGFSGSEYPNLKAEFSDTPFERGTVGAARSRDQDSANSQFFICFNDSGCKSLVGAYTVFGKVVAGMEHVDQIKRGDRAAGGKVESPDVIVKMYVQ